MKTIKKDTVLKVILLIAIIMSLSFESNAQITTITQITNKFLHPILKFTTNNAGGTDSTTPGLRNNRGYLDKGILIFEENLKVCKDIISGSEDSTSKDSGNRIIDIQSECMICNDSIMKETNASRVKTQKKKTKTYRNYPGNFRSKI